MPSSGFEPAISATKLPQTYGLGRVATGIGILKIIATQYLRTQPIAYRTEVETNAVYVCEMYYLL
jgi:hypothetical protein